jgi:hypothetical protein
MKLSKTDIDHVCVAIRRGARLLVGREATGRQKIKLIKGPFGLFVERYECDEADLAAIRSRLSLSRGRSNSNAAA